MDKFMFFNTASGKRVVRILDITSVQAGDPDANGNPRSVVETCNICNSETQFVSTDSVDVVISRLQNAGVM